MDNILFQSGPEPLSGTVEGTNVTFGGAIANPIAKRKAMKRATLPATDLVLSEATSAGTSRANTPLEDQMTKLWQEHTQRSGTPIGPNPHAGRPMRSRTSSKAYPHAERPQTASPTLNKSSTAAAANASRSSRADQPHTLPQPTALPTFRHPSILSPLNPSTNTSSAAILSSHSPGRVSVDDSTLLPLIHGRHHRSASDAAADRAHALEVPENQLERQWQQQQEKDESNATDMARDDRGPLHRGQQVPSEIENGSDKMGVADPWVLINSTTPPATKARLPPEPTVPKPSRNILHPTYRLERSAAVSSPLTAGSTTPLRPSSSRRVLRRMPYNMVVTWKAADPSHREAQPPTYADGQHSDARMAAKSIDDLRNPQRSNPGPQPKIPDLREPIPIPTSNAYRDGSREQSAIHVPTTGKSYETRAGLRPLPKYALPPQSTSPLTNMRRPAPQHSLSSNPTYANILRTAGDPYSQPSPATQNVNRFGSEVDDVDNIYTSQASRRQPSTSSHLGYGSQAPSSTSLSFNQNLRVNPSALTTRPPESSRTPPRSPASPRSPQRNSRPTVPEDFGLSASAPATTFTMDIQRGISSNETLRQESRDWIRNMLDGHQNDSATLIPKAADIGQSLRGPPREPTPPARIGSAHDPYESTLINQEASDGDYDYDLLKTLTTTHGGAAPRVPALAVVNNPMENSSPPSSFRHHAPLSGDYSSQPNRPSTDLSRLNPRPLANNKADHPGSTVTDHEETWAPRPAQKEVYDVLEKFSPEHDLDNPVIEAGSPTATEHPAPPLSEKDTFNGDLDTFPAIMEALARFDTDISPWYSPHEWNDAYNSHIRFICEALTRIMGKDKLPGAYLSSHMIYPGLIVYLFIQLTACATNEKTAFGDTLEKWRTWDDITVFEKHQQVKDNLIRMFIELKRLNSALHTRETFETLLALDVMNFSAQLTMLVVNNDCYKRLIKRHEEAAQALVNILQARLDYSIEPPFKSRHRKALVKLSERSQRYPECLLLEDITISEDPIQGGSFGEVFKGDMAGCPVAVKVLRVYQKSKMDKILKNFSREAVIWRQLSHPNVLPFYGILHRGVARLCLVSPWMKNGDMSHFLSQIDEIDCVPLVLDVAKGLEYLHSQHVLHADLKCGNILVSDAGRACLADFGLSVAKDSNSVLVTASSIRGVGGTLAWTAPELALGAIKKPDEACDVYSFGMVCYEMFSGCTPFEGSSIPQIIMAIHLGQRPERPVDLRARKRGLTDGIWDTIATCWHQQPDARLTAGHAVRRLSTLPDCPPDNRSGDHFSIPPPSRAVSRKAQHPFSILQIIRERDSTGMPFIPGSISEIFGLPDSWDSIRVVAEGPIPEEVYDRLEDFFPEHDLDKPVIEAGSDADSPTATEQPAPPLPEKDKSDKGIGRKTKKSIRIVAEEHKKRIDRTSRADNIASVLRKRSTKLWGSRMEEVATEQAKAEQARALYTALSPESSGGPRSIFKWVRGELIGKGTYSGVYLALDATTGNMIAVKQVETPQTASEKADTREAVFVKTVKSASKTLKDLDHANIVQYFGYEETPNLFSIFLEYVPGGSICSCLQKNGKFEVEVTKSFTEQILAGLEYLHTKNIIHRNLKSRNVLVETSGVIKMTDFANSERIENISNGASTTMQDNVFWMAPEVIDPPKKGYDKKIDIWSLGCVLLEMWAGKRPWSGDEAMAVIWKLHKSKLPPPVPDDVTLTPLAHNFRNLCFAINPDERPTAAKLRQHPYLALPPGWYY